MAGLWYRSGTIAVTGGSKKVVGTGTTWKSGVYKPDKGHLVWGPDGKAYEIDYVESDTVLYLVTVYAGVTAASQAYSIDITRTSTIPAFSRELSAQLAYAQAQYDSWQQILTGADMVTLTAPDGQQVQVPSLSAFQPTSASLKALQALTPVKDKIPVFNGSAGAELITLTPFMRELLDDADDDSALGTLGAAAVGHGHDGAYFGVVRGVVTDFNNALTEGLYYVGSSGLIPNAPYANGIFGRLVVYVSDAGTHNNNNNWIWQYFMNTGGDQFLRYKVNSSPWSAWVRDFNGFNVVGAVSRVGALPTGAIIETGSNGNGLYTKFADGTLLCQVTWDTSSWPANGSVTVPWTFPHPFASEPNCFANIKTQDPAKYWASVYTHTGNGISALVCAGGQLAGNGRAQYMAYGRWY